MENFTGKDMAETYGTGMIARRFFAHLVDIFILAIFSIALFINSFKAEVITYQIVLLIFSLLLHIYIIEGLSGYTFGKFIFRLRVITKDFNSPGILKILIRNSIKLIEINPFLFGGAPALIAVFSTKTRQRIGDIAADTFVVNSSDVSYKKINDNEIKNKISILLIILDVILFIITFNNFLIIKH